MPSITLASIDNPRMQPLQRETWQDAAVCTQLYPETFFLPKGSNGQSVAQVRKVCDTCSVERHCLAYAMSAEDETEDGRINTYRYGIFGGLSPRERIKLAKLMRKDKTMTLEEGAMLVRNK